MSQKARICGSRRYVNWQKGYGACRRSSGVRLQHDVSFQQRWSICVTQCHQVPVLTDHFDNNALIFTEHRDQMLLRGSEIFNSLRPTASTVRAKKDLSFARAKIWGEAISLAGFDQSAHGFGRCGDNCICTLFCNYDAHVVHPCATHVYFHVVGHESGGWSLKCSCTAMDCNRP